MFSFSQLTNYKMVLIINEPSCGLQAFIALHTGNKQMPAFGATRFWRYASQEEAFQDSLRLAKFMSYKAALAGLPYGGAKGVIIDYPGINREKALKKYAEYVELLGGRFITGSDIGIAQQDVKNWKRLSQYFVGVKVDPVKYTVLGIISGILASLEFRFGSKDPSQKTFAIQGLGKIGSGILQSLYGKAKKIYVTDISKDVVSAIKVRFPKVQVVPVSKIFSVQVDVVVPCALYGAINPTTVKQLKCQIVAGGANNQLASDKMGFELAK
ncbi:MAG: leucine dehydrogenase, partial [Candidatus Pacebacteria bacterium CG10_big_fil_rev_8_21_14_0_10_44_11]